MENGRSALGIFAGFVFWLGIAYYFYHRDFTGALWFVAAFGLIYGVYRLIAHLLASQPKTSSHAGRRRRPAGALGSARL